MRFATGGQPVPGPAFTGRVTTLSDAPLRGGAYVFYWMQQSQRAVFNHALEHAASRANESRLPLVVGFGLTADYPDANLRHYTFMLEGLVGTAAAVRARGAAFVLRIGDPADVAIDLAREAALVVCDRGYLRHQKAWRRAVAARAGCGVEQVESDVMVPVDAASPKAEFAARTLRPKLLRTVDDYLQPLRRIRLRHRADHLRLASETLDDLPALLARLPLDRSVTPVSHLFTGGTSVAQATFRHFLARRFSRYREHRNQPHTGDVSHMSKYLHFGQVSPVWLAREARRRPQAGGENVDSFLDELLVRRELAMNWCEFTEGYDRYDALPAWARRTLARHRRDRREHVYTRAELEAGETHDPYWNAAMQEMRVTGYMHNYMRMYWGKKILEWSRRPEEAFETALAINNKYFLDGRDAVSYANIGWVFGLHDRPWGERRIFGTVRYMNARGLERKTDIEAYVRKVQALAGS